MVQTPSPDVADARQLAAVDLGSNSFRLLVADVVPGDSGHALRLVDDLKESVRLGDGLDESLNLTPQAQQRALQVLSLFHERLRGFDPGAVRAVATNTFRVARNADGFLAAATERLGFPIDVIAGREEARLIYVGAAHSLPVDHELRLIVDIGGGSTECIIGRDFHIERRESFQIGCVALSRTFMPDLRITKQSLRRARIHCGEQLAGQVRAFRHIGWRYAIGTSGSAKALCQIAQAEFGSETLTAAILARIEAAALQAGHVSELRLQGLKPDRQAVFPGSLAAMQALFDEFGIESLRYCASALREGVLHELVGRRSGTDRREITIAHLVDRYRCDVAHGQHVADLAERLLRGFAREGATAEMVRMLRWAARAREIGASIAHDDAHRHGAYVAAHADLPGFSPIEQQRLAWLILGQTGGLRKLAGLHVRPDDWVLLLCLRLAVILQRRRDGRDTPILLSPAKGQPSRGWVLELPDSWVQAHPLTNRSLETEREEWREAGVFRHNDYRVVADPADVSA